MNTTTTNPTTTADTFTTAEELRELLEDHPHPDELQEALSCLPIDWPDFHAIMAGLPANTGNAATAGATEAARAALTACALPGHVISAEDAALIDRAIIEAGRLRKVAKYHDRAELLEDLRQGVRTRDADRLAVALGMAPYNVREYVARLQALADATDSAELGNPECLRVEQVKALQASATPGTVLDDELAGAILDGMQAWHAITTETPQQKAIREAFAEARRLIDLHGDEDPRTFSAIIKAVNLQDPGFIDAKLTECGTHLPAPDRCADDGTPLYSLDAIAEALDADPDDLLDHARELEAHGLGVLHVNANTHALQ